MPTKSKTALLLDEVFKKHRTGPGHPERPERYVTITRDLKAAGFVNKLPPIKLRDLTDDEAQLCHTPEYVAKVKKEIPAVRGVANLSTGDTTVCADSLDVAR